MHTGEAMEILMEDVFLEAVYGATSRKSRDEWVDNVKDDGANWILRSDKLREKVMSTAEINKRH